MVGNHPACGYAVGEVIICLESHKSGGHYDEWDWSDLNKPKTMAKVQNNRIHRKHQRIQLKRILC